MGKSELRGTVSCPPSKSYTHRMVFLASLSEGTSRIKNILHSEDAEATMRACRGFGADITEDGSDLVIRGNPEVKPADIDVANSGTTIRIAAAVAALAGGRSNMTGDSSIQKRPMGPLLEALEAIGARCVSEEGSPPLSVEGPIQGGAASIRGDVSSQFISALLMAAPLTPMGVELSITGEPVSRPYIGATISAMAKFGVQVVAAADHKKYGVRPGGYKGTEVVVPPDYSTLSLLLAASVLTGDGLEIEAENSDLPQGDKAFLGILEQLGVTLRPGKRIATSSPPRLNGGTFDLGDTPDLLPPLSILALKCDRMEIVNVGHARLKETDRIGILCRELGKLGLDIEERKDGMLIRTGGGLHGAELDPEGDHRLFMAFCIAGMHLGDCVIRDTDSVAVSYPGFVQDMKSVGAVIKPD
ncbi:5-enolpyruvylshikimate-3-phosphate synthase [Cenarchaeum symbiosum A]|uniref:3-phosphoshikimate 1-carboxyvinyltransferase n=1 Tax=Cenarchaeum symbiosum (strain A) TaxID=414004 RepID=A0RU31_CENSY|nr:5-enolpyruvylshikimate-3-phosphate synthase [Cenarchaeum symbiosum A]